MTGRRVVHHLDFKTGTVTTSRTTAHADTFAERIGGLRAQTQERLGEPALQEFGCVICDGCGQRAAIDLQAPELPPGWRTVEGAGDLCPSCE